MVRRSDRGAAAPEGRFGGIRRLVGDSRAMEELRAQIEPAEAVIILASTFSEQTDLVSYQMDVAEAGGKPLIAIRPFGGVAETPEALVTRVKEHIEWNEREIADALRRQARLEDTARWDVIDFP